ALSQINRTFPPHRRGRAMGLWSAAASVGQLAGPTLGGFLVEGYGWHGIFWVNVPVATTVFLLVLLGVKPLPLEPRKGRFDYGGAVTFAAGMGSALVGLSLLRVYGLGSPLVGLAGLLAVLFISVFIYIELRQRAPVVDLGLFKNRLFAVVISVDMLRA